jgi:hypothetical protein
MGSMVSCIASERIKVKNGEPNIRIFKYSSKNLGHHGSKTALWNHGEILLTVRNFVPLIKKVNATRGGDHGMDFAKLGLGAVLCGVYCNAPLRPRRARCPAG